MSAPPMARTYLPWVRQGLAGSVTTVDTLGVGVPGRAEVPVGLWLNDPGRARPGDRLAVPVRFHGPGDVVGLDPGQVVRTEPGHLATDVEPGLLAHVEFDRPDLPWLFTPARADAQGRLRPWIVLVLVERGPDTLGTVPGVPLPVLDAPRAALPDLTDSWAWAHAQLTRPADASGAPSTPLGGAFTESPERTVGRLVCPRRLRPQTTYLACVVPAFAAGRRAGLGEAPDPVQDAELRPAWEGGDAAARVRLPVHHHWEFTTGVGADFEGLVRRLEPGMLDPEVGGAPLDTSAPGWGIPALPAGGPGIALALGGALHPPGRGTEGEADVDLALRAQLRRAIDAPGGPDIAPPVYGQWYSREPGVPADQVAPHWLRELNLDPRMRAAAGVGTMVVRYEQERLMAAAWEQLAAQEATERETVRAQLAEEVSAALHDKHLTSMRPDRLVQVAGPALRGAGDTAPAQAEPAFRRLLGPGGALGRHLGTADGAPVAEAAVHPALAADAGAALTSASARSAAAAQLQAAASTDAPRFAPAFDQPMYEPLRDWFTDLLLPGLGQVAPNTIALLETNPRFIEAYLVGLNHELNRELTWRGFPTDRRGTSFRRFWGAPADGAPTGQAPGSIPPIREWPATSRLGEHLAATGLLVLLIRGDILTRFPRAVVAAVEAGWSPDGGRVPGATERPPLFRGSVGTDVTFLSFDLTADQARGTTDRRGHPGWFFVLREPPAEPRFGFDAEPADASAPDPAELARWSDATWAATGVVAGEHLTTGGGLATRTLPATAPAGPGRAPTAATWGTNAAHMALIAQQAPFQVAVHASAWLPRSPTPGG